MFRKCCLTGLVIAGMLASGCQKTTRVEAEYLPAEQKADFQPKRGMTRATVENVYGMPTDIGETKEGNVYAQYKFGNIVRTVEYDAADKVVVAYP